MLTKEQTTNLLSMLEIIDDRSEDKIVKVLVSSCVEIINADIRINKLAWRVWNKEQERREKNVENPTPHYKTRWRPRKITNEKPLLYNTIWTIY